MRGFIEFANENSKGLNVIVGAVATTVIVGLYVYVGREIVKNIRGEAAEATIVEVELVEETDEQ